ncbi:peptidoglycan-binding domain-containing protein [Kitasatospora sp. NPDC004669]|uniref:peptidoglycan-binding domain-containing protein n=1 Tax=Kitasatospora sp. NPDC004669 TaxID=3154555 RepID=UPI0033B94AD9
MHLIRRITTTGATLAATGAVLVTAVPSAHAATGLASLRQGSSGLGVACAQWTENIFLQPQTPLAVDGDFGPATYRATVQYQGENGLAQDGIIGPHTGDSITSFINSALKNFGDAQIWNGHSLSECYGAVPTSS